MRGVEEAGRELGVEKKGIWAGPAEVWGFFCQEMSAPDLVVRGADIYHRRFYIYANQIRFYIRQPNFFIYTASKSHPSASRGVSSPPRIENLLMVRDSVIVALEDATS